MQVEKCDICGRLSAGLQMCRLCKRRICEEHYHQDEGMCSQCYNRLGLTGQGAGQTSRPGVLFKLFFLGFLLMFVGFIVLFVAAWVSGNASVSGGAIIIIGFVPIVLGAGPYGFYAIVIAAILTIIAFAVFVWMRRRVDKS